MIFIKAIVFLFFTLTSAFAAESGRLTKENTGFDLKIKLSPAAQNFLQQYNTDVIVFYHYSALPKKGEENYAWFDGKVSVSNDIEKVYSVRELEKPISITPEQLDLNALSHTQGDLLVNLNVASSRKTLKDNVLRCDFIEGSVSKLRELSPSIHCFLDKELGTPPVRSIPNDL